MDAIKDAHAFAQTLRSLGFLIDVVELRSGVTLVCLDDTETHGYRLPRFIFKPGGSVAFSVPEGWTVVGAS